jgi:hypothetical protein
MDLARGSDVDKVDNLEAEKEKKESETPNSTESRS